MIVNMLITHH